MWVVLGFLLFRGTVQIIKPDRTTQLESSVNRQTAQLQAYVETKTDVGEFAKAFMQDYLTYNLGDSPDAYSKKIAAYGSGLAIQAVRFSGDATPVFLQVVRCTQYSADQWDALIRADVAYTKYDKQMVMQEDGRTSEEVTTSQHQETLYYIVPVYVQGGGLAVEALPMPTAIAPAPGQPKTAPRGQIVDGSEAATIKTTLTDFFNTYYTESQNKINYYLASDADPAQFYGLNGSTRFERIGELTIYRNGGGYTAVAHVITSDVIGTQQTAQLHLTLAKTDKYYIQSINARTENIL